MSDQTIDVDSYIFWSREHGWCPVDPNTAVFLRKCDNNAENRYDNHINESLFDVFGQLDQSSPDAQEQLLHCDEILSRESFDQDSIREADESPMFHYEDSHENLRFRGWAYSYCVTICNGLIISRTISLTNGEIVQVDSRLRF
jgi:hypothetical protein